MIVFNERAIIRCEAADMFLIYRSVILVLFVAAANAIFFPSCPTYCENKLAGIMLIRPKNCKCAFEHVLHKRNATDTTVNKEHAGSKSRLDIKQLQRTLYSYNPVKKRVRKFKIRTRNGMPNKGNNAKIFRVKINHSVKQEQNQPTALNNIHRNNKAEIEDYSNIQKYLSECIELHKIQISRLCTDSDEKTRAKNKVIDHFEKLSDDELKNEINNKCAKVKVIVQKSVNEIKENSFPSKTNTGKIKNNNEEGDTLKSQDNKQNDMNTSPTVDVGPTNNLLTSRNGDSTMNEEISDPKEKVTIVEVNNTPERTQYHISTVPSVQLQQSKQPQQIEHLRSDTATTDFTKPFGDILNSAPTNRIPISEDQILSTYYTTEYPKNKDLKDNSSKDYLGDFQPLEESSTHIILNHGQYRPLQLYFDTTTPLEATIHKKITDHAEDKSISKSTPSNSDTRKNNIGTTEHAPIIKLISREHSNGTILSESNGTEELTNNDSHDITNNFVISNRNADEHEDVTEYPNSPTTTTLGEINDFTNTKVNDETKPPISGHLFFLYDKEKIPARFIQSSNGNLNIGIDVFNICNVNDKENPTILLKLLCSCVKSKQCVSEMNEKNIM